MAWMADGYRWKNRQTPRGIIRPPPTPAAPVGYSYSLKYVGGRICPPIFYIITFTLATAGTITAPATAQTLSERGMFLLQMLLIPSYSKTRYNTKQNNIKITIGKLNQ